MSELGVMSEVTPFSINNTSLLPSWNEQDSFALRTAIGEQLTPPWKNDF
jgi:hypothetical protein